MLQLPQERSLQKMSSMKVISVNLALAPSDFWDSKEKFKKFLSGKILRHLLFLQNLSAHRTRGFNVQVVDTSPGVRVSSVKHPAQHCYEQGYDCAPRVFPLCQVWMPFRSRVSSHDFSSEGCRSPTFPLPLKVISFKLSLLENKLWGKIIYLSPWALSSNLFLPISIQQYQS